MLGTLLCLTTIRNYGAQHKSIFVDVTHVAFRDIYIDINLCLIIGIYNILTFI